MGKFVDDWLAMTSDIKKWAPPDQTSTYDHFAHDAQPRRGGPAENCGCCVFSYGADGDSVSCSLFNRRVSVRAVCRYFDIDVDNNDTTARPDENTAYARGSTATAGHVDDVGVDVWGGRPHIVR